MPRRIVRRDLNHRLIAEIWKACGWHVLDTAWAGQYVSGWPDLICTRWPLTVWIECKAPDEKLREDQAAFAADIDAPCLVCRSAQDAQQQAEKWRDLADFYAQFSVFVKEP